jgi:hypothetical protein
MARPNPSYLKQSLGQMPSLQNPISSKKPFLFPLTSQKIHFLPTYILSSCLLCNLYFKVNFYKNFKFIIGAEATN